MSKPSDLSLELIERIRDSIDGVLKETGSLIDMMGVSPAPSSLGDRELKEFKRQVSVKTAYDQASLQLQSSADYLSALCKSLTEPVETVAPWGLARSVMESAARSIWLGSPEISVDDRVGRSLAFRLDGLREQEKLAKLMVEVKNPGKIRFDHLVNTAKEIGATVKFDSSGKPSRIGPPLPPASKLCATELNEKATYHILSALAHSQSFALQSLSFKTIGPSSDDPDRVDATKDISNVSVAYLFHQAARAYIRAVAGRWKLFGFLNLETVRVLRRRCDEMNIPEEQFRYCIWSG